MDQRKEADALEKPTKFSLLGGNVRYLILLLVTLKMTFVMSNTQTLNFTVICMYKDDLDNSTSPLNGTGEPVHMWLFRC